MRKLGDLMKELGFNDDAAPGAQEAFVRNLIRQAYGHPIIQPSSQTAPAPTTPKSATPVAKSATSAKTTATRVDQKAILAKPQQLSFVLEDLVPAQHDAEARTPRRAKRFRR
jgi:hypothetical protein